MKINKKYLTRYVEIMKRYGGGNEETSPEAKKDLFQLFTEMGIPEEDQCYEDPEVDQKFMTFAAFEEPEIAKVGWSMTDDELEESKNLHLLICEREGLNYRSWEAE